MDINVKIDDGYKLKIQYLQKIKDLQHKQFKFAFGVERRS